MISKAPVEIVFVEMSPEEYERKFWARLGGYDEELAAQLAQMDAIETARKNGHAPWKLAQYVKESQQRASNENHQNQV